MKLVTKTFLYWCKQSNKFVHAANQNATRLPSTDYCSIDTCHLISRKLFLKVVTLNTEKNIGCCCDFDLPLSDLTLTNCSASDSK